MLVRYGAQIKETDPALMAAAVALIVDHKKRASDPEWMLENLLRDLGFFVFPPFGWRAPDAEEIAYFSKTSNAMLFFAWLMVHRRLLAGRKETDVRKVHDRVEKAVKRARQK